MLRERATNIARLGQVQSEKRTLRGDPHGPGLTQVPLSCLSCAAHRLLLDHRLCCASLAHLEQRGRRRVRGRTRRRRRHLLPSDQPKVCCHGGIRTCLMMKACSRGMCTPPPLIALAVSSRSSFPFPVRCPLLRATASVTQFVVGLLPWPATPACSSSSSPHLCLSRTLSPEEKGIIDKERASRSYRGGWPPQGAIRYLLRMVSLLSPTFPCFSPVSA